MTPKEFQAAVQISDEALERFVLYANLLRRWQKKINLIGPATISNLWSRHFLDSTQLFPLIPPDAKTLIDIGSGAGFPGLVLAMLLEDQDRPIINLVEAKHRKAQFLVEASRITGARAIIHSRRIESLHELKADVITARACAPLKKLFGYAHPVLVSRGTCLFLKGQNFQEELTESEKTWKMKVMMTRSLTNDSGVILTVKNLFRRL